MKTERIKKLDIFSFAKFQALLLGLLGLLCGIIYSFGGFLLDLAVSLRWIHTSETPGLSYGTILAFGALIGMPFLFAIGGYILGVLEAILFNLATKFVGKMELKFEGE